MPVWKKYNPADWQRANKNNKNYAKRQPIPKSKEFDGDWKDSLMEVK